MDNNYKDSSLTSHNNLNKTSKHSNNQNYEGKTPKKDKILELTAFL